VFSLKILQAFYKIDVRSRDTRRYERAISRSDNIHFPGGIILFGTFCSGLRPVRKTVFPFRCWVHPDSFRKTPKCVSLLTACIVFLLPPSPFAPLEENRVLSIHSELELYPRFLRATRIDEGQQRRRDFR